MSTAAKSAFFDAIADKWDGWDDLAVLHHKLGAGLASFGVQPHETVLDIGCGTGNLTRALLECLEPSGRVVAVDISPKMIDVAQKKVNDQRVAFHVCDASRLPIDDASCDRIICYSVWPHLGDLAQVTKEFSRVLKPSGILHVWHLIGRKRVNDIHAGAGEAVRADILEPADCTSSLLSANGFNVSRCVDTETDYLVTAMKR